MAQWLCRLLEETPAGLTIPGDMWYAHRFLDVLIDGINYLSHYYHTHNRWRPPIIVTLPDGSEWCPDARQWPDRYRTMSDGWTVTGNPPKLTIAEDIYLKTWQGRLVGGVLMDGS